MTPEREKEIRKAIEVLGEAYCDQGIVEELLAEVDLLRDDNDKLNERLLSLTVIMQDHTEPEIARLRAEVERLRDR